jgi:hypothetical protein
MYSLTPDSRTSTNASAHRHADKADLEWGQAQNSRLLPNDGSGDGTNPQSRNEHDHCLLLPSSHAAPPLPNEYLVFSIVNPNPWGSLSQTRYHQA